MSDPGTYVILVEYESPAGAIIVPADENEDVEDYWTGLIVSDPVVVTVREASGQDALAFAALVNEAGRLSYRRGDTVVEEFPFAAPSAYLHYRKARDPILGDGRGHVETLLEGFPNSRLAPLAQLRLVRLCYDMADFDGALREFERVDAEAVEPWAAGELEDVSTTIRGIRYYRDHPEQR